jgi:hypothetical protein
LLLFPVSIVAEPRKLETAFGFAGYRQPIKATLKCSIPIDAKEVRTNRPFDGIYTAA